MRKLAPIVAILFFASSTLFALQTKPATVTGTWTGTLTLMKDGQPVDEDPMHVMLKQAGAVVTGTAGPNTERQYEVMKGKIETTKAGTILTFDVAANNGALLLHFELKLAEGKLNGTATAEQNGEKMEATVALQSAK